MLIETPAARNTDPESSHEAAAENLRSGRRNRQQMQVLEALRRTYMRQSGITSAELSKLSGLDYHAICRRLPELETVGLVERGRDDNQKPLKRRCAVTGNSACFWWPVPKQERLV